MSDRKLINDIYFLNDFINKIKNYPYIPPYIEVYLSEAGSIKWAINRIEPDPIKVKDFFGSTYESRGYLYVTDMPFPLYDAISLVYGIDKNQVKNILAANGKIDEKLLITKFGQSSDFYFKQKEVYRYLSDNGYELHHIIDIDLGVSLLKFSFNHRYLKNIEKISLIIMAVEALKEGYKSVFATNNTYLRWDSHKHEEIYIKSAYLYLYNTLSFLTDLLTDSNVIKSSFIKKIQIFSERVPWKRKLNIQLFSPRIPSIIIKIKNGRRSSEYYLTLNTYPSQRFYEETADALKASFEKQPMLSSGELIISDLYLPSFKEIGNRIKNFIEQVSL